MNKTNVLKQTTLTTVMLLAYVLSSSAPANSGIQIDTKSLKDATHIEFSGRDEWRYDISRSPQTVTVQFMGIRPDDISDLSDLKDRRITKIVVTEGTNNDAKVTFHISPGLNLFDYQTDEPVHLVFDVFKDSPKKVKKVSKIKSVPKKDPDGLVSKKKSGRNIASLEHPEIGEQPLLNDSTQDSQLTLKYGIFDGGDQNMNRFKILPGDTSTEAQESGLVRSAHSFYIHFPPLVLQRPFLNDIVQDPTTKYDVPADNTSDENLQVRLMIKLFNEGKYAVVFRTLKFFQEKYPTSSYEKTLDFLTADTYFKLWLRDHSKVDLESAMARYKEILNKYPADPARYHTLMFIGANYLQNGNNLGALSAFQVGINKYPESPFLMEMKLAQADVLNQLNKPDAALEALEKMEKDPLSGSYAIEAHLRRGDVFFRKKDYSAAVAEYKEAIKKYPDRNSDAPNLYFNQAESQFWMKDYKSALDTYREFLQRYPNHPYGGFAMTRIGEIFDIMGVNPKKITGAYLESYYRFRGTPGAFIAKLYVNLNRFATMKEKEVAEVKREISEELPQCNYIEDFDPFVTLNLAKGNLARGEFQPALDSLIGFYKKFILSPYLPLFKEFIVQTINDQIEHFQESDNSLKAVETYLAHRDSWLKGSRRVDIYYLLGRAYEKLNLLDDAQKTYVQAQEILRSLTPEELKAQKYLEQLPSAEELNLRLAATNLKNENIKGAGQYLAEIKIGDTLTESEKVEKALLLSSLAEKEERTDLALLALKDLNENWKGKPEFLASAWLQMAKLETTHGKYAEALPWVVKVVGAGENVNEGTMGSALELAGDVHSNLGQNKQAIASYQAYLDRFGTKAPTAAVKYKLGKIYFDQKDLRTASQIWSDLKTDEKAHVWAKMAEENLSQANWDAKYGKYLDRAPAGGAGR